MVLEYFVWHVATEMRLEYSVWYVSELNVFWLLKFLLFEQYKILAFSFFDEDFTNFMTDCLFFLFFWWGWGRNGLQDSAIEGNDILIKWVEGGTETSGLWRFCVCVCKIPSMRKITSRCVIEMLFLGVGLWLIGRLDNAVISHH